MSVQPSGMGLEPVKGRPRELSSLEPCEDMRKDSYL